MFSEITDDDHHKPIYYPARLVIIAVVPEILITNLSILRRTAAEDAFKIPNAGQSP
jgi:hypothetical protein